jgi:transcription elongation factor S-II
VDEKQTRASDEPTTKFFECYNCGDKFRICWK